MSLLKELKETQNLTEREAGLRDYLVNHPEHVLHMSTRQLGEATFTSGATVTRFCKKFDCDGWADFKLRFAGDLKLNHDRETDEAVQLSERENMVTLLQKVRDIHDLALNATQEALSLSQLIRIQKLLLDHPYIDFYAYDANLHLARYACSQLFHAGRIATTYSETNVQVLSALAMQPGHLAVLISHTGENSRLIELSRLLRKNKRKIITITAGKETTLARMADEFLFVPHPYDDAETEARQFGIPIFSTAAKYLLDLMFSIVFSNHYEYNVQLNQQYEAIGASSFWDLNGAQ